MTDDYITEAEAISDHDTEIVEQYEDGTCQFVYTDQTRRQLRQMLFGEYDDHRTQRVAIRQTLYQRAIKARVGDTIQCAFCGNEIIKKSYQHKFCKSTTRGSSCKDKYHNYVDDQRFIRMEDFN